MRHNSRRVAGSLGLNRRSILSGAFLSLAGFFARYGGAAAGLCADISQGRASTTVSVFDHIPSAEWNAIRQGTSNYDCTADIHRAIDAVDGTGGTLVFPEGTYLVSTVRLGGTDYRAATSRATFQQKKLDPAAGKPIVSIVSASRLQIENLNVRGNIAHDEGEYSHGVEMSMCKDVTLARIFAEDVRGDALYCYARNTSYGERQINCYAESVSGRNVFRNLLTVVGGQVHVGSVINNGPVGYRDFDVEPNGAGGTYEAVDLRIDFARVGSCETTSDDPAVINRSVRIGRLEADCQLVQPTTPPYPRAPGAGAYAIGIARTQNVEIGYFSARNYNLYPVNLAGEWAAISIGTLDIARCSLNDDIYSAIILQQGDAHAGVLNIGTLICETSGSKYLARVLKSGNLNIHVHNIKHMKCLIGVQLSGGFSNGTIDIDNGRGIALSDSRDIVFENITLRNAAHATGFYRCRNVVFINSKMDFGVLDRGGSTIYDHASGRLEGPGASPVRKAARRKT